MIAPMTVPRSPDFRDRYSSCGVSAGEAAIGRGQWRVHSCAIFLCGRARSPRLSAASHWAQDRGLTDCSRRAAALPIAATSPLAPALEMASMAQECRCLVDRQWQFLVCWSRQSSAPVQAELEASKTQQCDASNKAGRSPVFGPPARAMHLNTPGCCVATAWLWAGLVDRNARAGIVEARVDEAFPPQLSLTASPPPPRARPSHHRIVVLPQGGTCAPILRHRLPARVVPPRRALLHALRHGVGQHPRPLPRSHRRQARLRPRPRTVGRSKLLRPLQALDTPSAAQPNGAQTRHHAHPPLPDSHIGARRQEPARRHAIVARTRGRAPQRRRLSASPRRSRNGLLKRSLWAHRAPITAASPATSSSTPAPEASPRRARGGRRPVGS